MSKKKVVLFWSGGKDSALALKRIKEDDQYQLVSLFTLIDQKTGEVRHHGIPEVLISAQAKLMNLPLIRAFIPESATGVDYFAVLKKYTDLFKAKGIDTLVFGDIHNKELKAQREDLFSTLGMNLHFPLWGQDSHKLLEELLSSGHRMMISGILEEKLDLSFLGKEIDHELIKRMPEGVDVMGENGEYQSFVNFGPSFKLRVQFSKNITATDGAYTIARLREA